MIENEYLVNLDVIIIKNVIAAAGLSHEFVSEKALFRDKNFLDECFDKKTMPKTYYMLLCDFFNIGYPTFSSDDKYVFAKDDNRATKVEHQLSANAKVTSPMDNIEVKNMNKTTVRKTRSKVNDGSIVEFNKDELKTLLKNSNINRVKFCINHNKSAGYIYTCMQTCRMDKIFYDELIKELNNDIAKIEEKLMNNAKRVYHSEKADEAYKAKIKDLIKQTGKSQSEISVMCNMSKSYISAQLATNHLLNDNVYNMIVQLANAAQDNSTVEERTEKAFNTIEQVKSDEIFQEVVPEKIDLVKVTINNKSYILVDEEKFNKLIDSLAMSTDILEYVSRVTK